MHKLIRGVQQFQATVFEPQREMFERLAEGQSPETLFITCSDSRINPSMLTQTVPGELFIARNAGNIVPPARELAGEAATIEYAVGALGVKDIVICGHTGCGAMAALLDPTRVRDLPAVKQWIRYAEATRRVVEEKYPHLEGEDLQTAAAQENVLVQLEHLRTHPAVASRLARGDLQLHGWVYGLATGEVHAYSPEAEAFIPLSESSARTSRTTARGRRAALAAG